MFVIKVGFFLWGALITSAWWSLAFFGPSPVTVFLAAVPTAFSVFAWAFIGLDHVNDVPPIKR